MSYDFKPNMYREIEDERLYREETKAVWHDIPGSKTEFRLTQNNLKMYVGATIILNQGVVTGHVYEYKPMFQLRYYGINGDNRKFNILFNTANAQFLSTTMKILAEDSSIISFFNKSDTSVWYVKQQYKDKKVMPAKDFSKTAFVEIFPEVDERRLPSYKFRWCKDQDEVVCIFTKGELLTLSNRLDGFINQCPMYINIFENELLKQKLNTYAEQMNVVQNTMFALSAKMDDILKEIKVSNEQTKLHFSTSLNSVLSVVAAANKTVNNTTMITETVSTLVEDQLKTISSDFEEDTEFIISREDHTKELLEMEPIVDTKDFPKLEEIDPDDMENRAEEQPNGYFNTPTMYANARMEEVIEKSKDSAKELIPVETEEVEKNLPNIQSIEEFVDIKVEEPEPEKWEIDVFTNRLHERFKLDFVDDPKLRNKKTIPFEEIYPKDLHKYITEATEEVCVTMSCIPEEKHEFMKTFNLDTVLEQLGSKVEKNKKYTLAHYMIDSGMFTKAYIAGMLINRGRIGIPVSSIVYATSVYATAYELIDRGQDALKIANECGTHILKSFVEAPNISGEKRDIYNKYFESISASLIGEEVDGYDPRLFAIDKLILREAYEFSAFDFNLDKLSNKEKGFVAQALMDVYIMLYYAEHEHMLHNSQTSPNHQLYFLVNKHMYRFARAMLVNMIRCNKDVAEVKMGMLFNAYDMKSLCERIGWEITKYRDALITFFVTNEMSKRFVEPNINEVDSMGYIKNTSIYRGLPCQEIMDIISKIV